MFYKKYFFNDAVISLLIDRTTQNEGGCWIYPGEGERSSSFKISKGRYSVKLALYVTFFSEEFANWNPEITKVQTDNTCNNVKCVNPHHVFVRGTEKFFWYNVNVGNDNQCWEWKGKATIGSGYAGHAVNGYRQQQYVHRLAYMFSTGQKIVSGVIAHLCNNKICCNPAHLFERVKLRQVWYRYTA